MNRCEAYNEIISDTVHKRKLEVAVYLNTQLTQVKANTTTVGTKCSVNAELNDS